MFWIKFVFTIRELKLYFFVELLTKIISPIMNIYSGTKFTGKTLFQQ